MFECEIVCTEHVSQKQTRNGPLGRSQIAVSWRE